MPEGPEVENIVRSLNRKEILNQPIVDVLVKEPKLVTDPDFVKKIALKTICSITRRGKYIVFHLSDKSAIVVHLRMSGHFLKEPRETDKKHIHLIFILKNGERIFYRDVRKFGRFYWTNDLNTFFKNIGPEPLENSFTVEILKEKLEHKKIAIKKLLLDQSFVAGIGNIYSDEILWDAQIHPQRQGASLTNSEITALHKSIQKILKRGIENGGTTLGKDSSHYFTYDGSSGTNQQHLCVYSRKDLPCKRCKTKIKKIKLAQRGTYFCPKCQLSV